MVPHMRVAIAVDMSSDDDARFVLEAERLGVDAESDGEHFRNLPMASVSAPTEVGSDN